MTSWKSRASSATGIDIRDCRYTLSPRPNEWTFVRHNGSRYVVRIGGRFHLNDNHVQRQAALEGLGILHMPRLFVQKELDSGQLVQLWPEKFELSVTLAAVYPSRHELPATVRAFVDFMDECCQGV